MLIVSNKLLHFEIAMMLLSCFFSVREILGFRFGSKIRNLGENIQVTSPTSWSFCPTTVASLEKSVHLDWFISKREILSWTLRNFGDHNGFKSSLGTKCDLESLCSRLQRELSASKKWLGKPDSTSYVKFSQL